MLYNNGSVTFQNSKILPIIAHFPELLLAEKSSKTCSTSS